MLKKSKWKKWMKDERQGICSKNKLENCVESHVLGGGFMGMGKW